MLLTRRQFVTVASSLGFSVLLGQATTAWGAQVDAVDSPLDTYPLRDWEEVYRDLYKADESFVFLCAPNDTHNCLLRAHVRNGVVTRIGPTFRYGEATDLYKNEASHRWDPRCCQKGLALVRRIYGDRRIRYPMIRRGFKEWVDKGFPRDPKTGRPPPELFRRGQDTWVRASWDQVSDVAARTLLNIARTYSGDQGEALLRQQGYDHDMIGALERSGTRTIKVRGGMPLLGTRIYGLNRFANSLALLDAHVRKVGPEEAHGARGWDSYSWHTDLPPGHPMVTGQQTVDFDLNSVEQAKLVLVWGMNWICTKMPDGHWLTEARLKGTRVVVIACEYSATASKGDDVIVVRPGTTPALALGLAQVIIKEKLYDESFVRRFTDLPLLVRLDTLALLRATDLDPADKPAALGNQTRVLGPKEKAPPLPEHREQLIPEALRNAMGDFVVWDKKTGGPRRLTRDQVGDHLASSGIDPEIDGEYEVKLEGKKPIKVRTVFSLVRQMLEQDYGPATVSQLTWAPIEAIERLARQIASARGKTLFALGMGPNQFFNNDLKDRAVFLLASLTANIGELGGNVGSFAGNYRTALISGIPQWIYEDPFHIELDPAKPARTRPYWKGESAHFFNYGDRMLNAGDRRITGKTHTPTPSKAVWLANSNSIIGNAKWHFDLVANTLPKVEMLAIMDWWWSGSCEYADIVFAVDSWAETKFPDMCAAVTNPFLTVYPRTPLPRLHESRSDFEVVALTARRLAALTGDRRFEDFFRFIHEGRPDVYLERVVTASTCLKGYHFAEMEEKARQGIPTLLMTRTTPRCVGWEQTHESRPWYTKTGRLEFYREEAEFVASGENLPVHREPVDSTFFEPNVIVCGPQPTLQPSGPEKYGLAREDLSVETRQVRHVARPWSEVSTTTHPLMKHGFKFVFHTPKYRHGAHTTPIDTDIVAVWFGPFGDVIRQDKRTPFVTEGYVDINPDDARELGVEDGDYVWIDSDPSDRPYRGAKPDDPFYKVARLLARARYYPGTPRGVTRMWFNMYGATPGSVEGAATRPDGLAKSPTTGYQAMFRSGSHQSGTRAWLKPTLMTDTLVRKEGIGQQLGIGFLSDIHCPTGAPRESFVKITKAEPGGLGGTGLWRPAALGYRPRYEGEAMKRFLLGAYVVTKGKGR
ncbi:MAG: molybdopterin-dependent oxidoreductase [Candidatus Riflebacteria bacterium]|nr:molybdopterin-dependent oxidoreductase [Candidatus Riflebacteria bacterium]